MPLFVNGAYTSQSWSADAERLVNWYPERMESQAATTRGALYPTPGVEVFATASNGGGRAMFAMNGRCFAVVGESLIEIASSGAVTTRGTLAVDTNPATICTNGDGGNQLFITSGGNGYCFDLLTNTLTTELTGTAQFGGMVYGYFVALNTTDSRFVISDAFDGTTWDPTQFADRTIAADRWVSMVATTYGQVWLLGSQSSEVWYNAGTAPFPFAPDPSGLIPYGCAAPFSAKETKDSVVWLATTRTGGYQVVQAKGFTPQPISTHAVEYAISQYDTVADAYGETYEDQGHAFYVLTFPSAQVTWVYDFNTGLWHERGTWIAEQGQYQAWRPTWHCFAFNQHLWADRSSATIYTAAIDLPLDVDGRPIRRLRRTPAVFREHQRLQIARLEVWLDAGVGTPTGQGQTPQVMLRASTDGGRTWGPERTASAGAQGQYQARAQWWRLGQSRDRVFEVSVSDPVPWRLLDAFLTVQRSTEAA